MPDLTRLLQAREHLQEARFSGLRRIIDQNGESIEYKSDGEIARAIAAIDSEIASLRRKRLGLVYLQTSKGV